MTTQTADGGTVELRTNRETGTRIHLIDARSAREFDEAEGGRWITLCEKHGAFVQHETRSLARSFMAAPSEWCENCWFIVDEGR